MRTEDQKQTWRTFQEWNLCGRIVTKGEKSKARTDNDEGCVPLFHIAQTSKVSPGKITTRPALYPPVLPPPVANVGPIQIAKPIENIEPVVEEELPALSDLVAQYPFLFVSTSIN